MDRCSAPWLFPNSFRRMNGNRWTSRLRMTVEPIFSAAAPPGGLLLSLHVHLMSRLTVSFGTQPFLAARQNIHRPARALSSHSTQSAAKAANRMALWHLYRNV